MVGKVVVKTLVVLAGLFFLAVLKTSAAHGQSGILSPIDAYTRATPPPSCQGDFDCDGSVYPSDLMVFLPEYGRTDCAPCIPSPVAKTGQTTSYATGDDGDLQTEIGVAWPVPRFLENYTCG